MQADSGNLIRSTTSVFIGAGAAVIRKMRLRPTRPGSFFGRGCYSRFAWIKPVPTVGRRTAWTGRQGSTL